jgi:glycerate 2-kinase
MNILIAPNSMKGSLSALRFAEITEQAFQETDRHFFQTRKVPVADGGDGTAEVLIHALGLKKHTLNVRDPLGRIVPACFGYNHKTAVVEMASASGMKLLSSSEFNPLEASTFGTGQLIVEAVRLGATCIYLGVGGSATVDGGTGILEALGVSFFDANGHPLSGTGENLTKIYRLEMNKLRIPSQLKIHMISDVSNPLLGEEGAARLYAPQKGATPEMTEELEKGLRHYAQIVAETSGIQTAHLQGAGAAGGIAVSLAGLLNAEILRGADFILEKLSFQKHLHWADVVITGEGTFDRQSLQGKAPAVVAEQARKLQKPVVAIVGENRYPKQALFDHIYSLTEMTGSSSQAVKKAAEWVYALAKILAHTYRSTYLKTL